MAFDKGFDFQASNLGSDPSDCTSVLATDTTSTTRNGATLLWSDTGFGTLDSRDRTGLGGSRDHRLRGINFVPGSDNAVWTLTLPSTGDYDIYLAAGDPDNVQTVSVQ